MNRAFLSASLPKKMKIILFCWFHKPDRDREILKVIKFLKNFWEIISDTEFVFSEKDFSAGDQDIDTWRYHW